MSEFRFPAPAEQPPSQSFFELMSNETKTELMTKAVGLSLANELMGVTQFGEFEREYPELVEWAKNEVVAADKNWNEYAHFMQTPLNGERDDLTIESFIVNNADILVKMQENAVENSLDIQNMTLVFFPHWLFDDVLPVDADKKDPLPILLSEFRAAGLANDDVIAPPVLEYLKGERSMGIASIDDLMQNLFERMNSNSSQPTVVWDMFAMSEAKDFNPRNSTTSPMTDMDILDWWGATIQETSQMLGTEQIALPLHRASLESGEFIICGSYDKDEKHFELNLMPLSAKNLKTRSIIRGY